MYKLFLIASGGAIGALFRYLISGHFYRIWGEEFPWGTLVVNLIGCFLIGIFWAVSELFPLQQNTNIFLFVGVLGAFTTFSTYSLESLRLLQQGQLILGITYITVSNVVGLAAILAGKVITNNLFGLFIKV